MILVVRGEFLHIFPLHMIIRKALASALVKHRSVRYPESIDGRTGSMHALLFSYLEMFL